MKEIKFRAWKKKKKMFFNVQLSSFGDVLYDDDNYATQFTGLKDKNGKELYFGDIVKLKDNENNWEVNQDDFGIPLFETNAYNMQKYQLVEFSNYFSNFGKHDFEIIGNIFENANLLNK